MSDSAQRPVARDLGSSEDSREPKKVATQQGSEPVHSVSVPQAAPGFTPGPWKMFPSWVDRTSNFAGTGTYEISPNGYDGQDSAFWIAHVMSNHVHGKANAALILAAPDLYEGCRRAREVFSKGTHIHTALTAALAKARGVEAEGTSTPEPGSENLEGGS